jgi:hypothetical protein
MDASNQSEVCSGVKDVEVSPPARNGALGGETLPRTWRKISIRDASPSESGSVPEPLVTFEGDSTRSVLKGRYDLIPREAIDAIARRLELGASRHGENNWKGGGEEFRKATINHLFNHLLDYLRNGDTSEANTDAIICNAAFLCYFERIIPFK